ncbi:protein ACCELERATED CELL DEATH 6-like [Rutidosis leptorrhynchoides]|uniref:protein ACCELERATED CELL DEATH 6-like n=1 Tax=Rutidosis leptorrhynchoides TaxID=125765 RepID=UPI003A9A2BD5
MNIDLVTSAQNGFIDKLFQQVIKIYPDLVTREKFIGDTPVHVAARVGKIHVVEALVFGNDHLIIGVNRDGNTPLHEAVIHNRDEVVKILLRKPEFRKAALEDNKEGKSAVYLAVESGNTRIPNYILEFSGGVMQYGNHGTKHHTLEKSNLVGGDITNQIGVAANVAAMTKKDTEVIHLHDGSTNAENSNFAASSSTTQIGDFKSNKHVLYAAIIRKDIGILRLVADNVTESLVQNNHLLPLAASLGFLDGRVLTNNRHNILHVAAENGKDNVVRYILKYEWAEFLINEKDKDECTPLHLATINWHPKVVSTLTWDRLISMALTSVGIPRAQIKDADTVKRLTAAKYEPYNMDYCKDRVNTLLLVSALVATMTFVAGFTMPGGTKSSGKHEGMASMTNKIQFQLFVIFDSIAVCITPSL